MISIPWATVNGKTYIGWNFVLPFTFPYVLGLLLSLIVLLTKAYPFGLSLAAGILMFLGVLGGMFGLFISESVGMNVEVSGIPFAFIWSLIYTVAGSILGKRMAERQARPDMSPTSM